jgi:hypothetical protein
MSLEPTATVLAAAPPTAAPTIGSFYLNKYIYSSLINPYRAPISRKPIEEEDEGAINSGSNLFVTGIHPRLTESDISRLFEKYGDVDNCSIMLDPHTKESRGFGFVNMVTAEQADAAKEGLQGEVIEGRTLSIEKARRARPRTPTPGKYFGPPKRGKFIPAPLYCFVLCRSLHTSFVRGWWWWSWRWSPP